MTLFGPKTARACLKTQQTCYPTYDVVGIPLQRHEDWLSQNVTETLGQSLVKVVFGSIDILQYGMSILNINYTYSEYFSFRVQEKVPSSPGVGAKF